MKKSKILLAIIAFGVSLCFSIWCVWKLSPWQRVTSPATFQERSYRTPSEIVSLYWKLSEEGKIEEASNHTMMNITTRLADTFVSKDGEKNITLRNSEDLHSVGPPSASELEATMKHFFRIDFPKFIHERKLVIFTTENEIINNKTASVIATVGYKEKNIKFKIKHLLYKDSNSWKIVGIEIAYGH